MFGTYSVINVIVLLNLLIAMMNHSYQLVSVSSVSVYKRKSKFSGCDEVSGFFHQDVVHYFDSSRS